MMTKWHPVFFQHVLSLHFSSASEDSEHLKKANKQCLINMRYNETVCFWTHLTWHTVVYLFSLYFTQFSTNLQIKHKTIGNHSAFRSLEWSFCVKFLLILLTVLFTIISCQILKLKYVVWGMFQLKLVDAWELLASFSGLRWPERYDYSNNHFFCVEKSISGYTTCAGAEDHITFYSCQPSTKIWDTGSEKLGRFFFFFFKWLFPNLHLSLIYNSHSHL